MIKKIILNILILLVSFFLPYYILSLAQADIRIIEAVQVKILLVILTGSCLLTFLNHKFRKQALNKKWVWLLFEIIGIIGFIYSAVILWLLYEFRNGIGF